jgi:hypothetical protein
VERILGALAEDCARESTAVPVIIAVTMGETSVVLRLAAPHPDPPAPWTSSPDATRWMLADRDLPDPTAGMTVSSGLIAVGLAGRPTTLVDLVRARGVIRLDGDHAARIEVAHRFIDEYTRAPWSRGRRIGLVGLPVLSTEATVDLSVADVVVAIEEGSAGLALVAEFSGGENDVNGEDAADLRRALDSPDCRWAVVALAGAGPARWTFTAALDGTATSDVFPISAGPPLSATSPLSAATPLSAKELTR